MTYDQFLSALLAGTRPASWYPSVGQASNAAASTSPLSPGPLDASFLFGPSPALTPSAAPTQAPAPSLYSPAPSTSPSGLDFASLFPYLKLGAQGAGLAGNLAGVPGAGGVAGGLGGLLNIGSGVNGLMNGQNPVASGMQLGSGALSAYGGLNSLAPGTFPSMSGAAVQAFVNAFPETAASMGLTAGGQFAGDAAGALAGQTVGSLIGGMGFGPSIVTLGSDLSEGVNLDKNEQLVSHILQAIPVVGAPLAMITNAIEQSLNSRNSWPSVAKQVTGMKENSLKGMTAAGSVFDQLKAAGVTDPAILQRALTMGSNALFPSYQKIDGSGINGPFGVSDYFAHTKADQTAYNAAQTGLQSDLWSTLAGLHSAGVPNSALASLPVNPKWGESYLGGIPVQQAAAAQVGGPSTFTFNGMPMSSAQLSNPMIANLGSGVSPFSTEANNSVTGGPLMSMTAALNPSLYGQIGGGYNFSGPAAQQTLAAATNTQYHPQYQDLSGPQG